LKQHKRNKRVVTAACILSLCTVIGVYAALKMPALGIEGKNISVTAEQTETAAGQNLTVKVSSTAIRNQDQTVFYLETEGTGPGLTGQYVFSEDPDQTPAAVTENNTEVTASESITSDSTETEAVSGTEASSASQFPVYSKTEITLDGSDKTVTLHRIAQSESLNEYWFSLSKDQAADFSLVFQSASPGTLLFYDTCAGTIDEARQNITQIKTEQTEEPVTIEWTEAQSADAVADSTVDLTQAVQTAADSQNPLLAVQDNSTVTSNARSSFPGTIETADTVADGITLNLFDYSGLDDRGNEVLDTGTNTYSNGSVNSGINSGKAYYSTDRDKYLQFYGYGNESTNTGKYSINNFTGTKVNKAMQNIVQPSLGSDGFPSLNTNAANKSLSYLFTTSSSWNDHKTVYANVNHLFTKDDNGYYQYDSNKNYAWYGSSSGGGNFTVYNTTYTTADEAYPIGFFPFDQYDSSRNNPTLWTQNGVASSKLNHHFGLSMSATFTMPKDGTVDGRDMVFDYSGDDDMWVFVDDVLVLDLGGIHEPASGSINFATGKVTYGETPLVANINTQKSYTTNGKQSVNISDLFKNAGKTYDSSGGTDHTIKVFYIERGGIYSDLKISFNLQLKKQGTLEIAKDLKGTETLSDEELSWYKNQSFKCKLYLENYAGADEYSVYTGAAVYSDTGATVTYDEDGNFLLKPGQSIKVETNIYRKYYVTESEVDSSRFGKIGFSPGDEITETPTNEGTFGAQSSTARISDRPKLTVDNYPLGNPNIIVQKKWYDEHGNEVTDTITSPITFELWRKSTQSVIEPANNHRVTFQAESGYQQRDKGYIDVGNNGTVSFFFADEGYYGNWYNPDYVTVNGSRISSSGTYRYYGRNYNLYTVSGITADTTVVAEFSRSTAPSSCDLMITSSTPQDSSTTTTKTVDEKVKDISIGLDQKWTWNGYDATCPEYNSSGNPYYYYVKENPGDDYYVTYDYSSPPGTNGGITTGTIVMSNIKYGYKYPATGGSGSENWMFLGILIMTASAVCYKHQKTDSCKREV
ncbi:MAG: fibro-slime domain-containing protein, partial [Eubacteriaceae bacterium]